MRKVSTRGRPDPQPGGEPLRLRDPERIRALASPARQEIVDTVQALGVCSIREIARELGRPADGLYYHVRALRRAGLLVDAGAREEGGRREALVATPGPEAGIRLDYAPEDPENMEAVARVAASMLRVTERDFVAALGREGTVVEGPRRELWASRTKGWLAAEELEEVNELLARLQEIFHRPRRAGQRLHALTFVLAPVEAAPVRREAVRDQEP